MSTRQQRKEKLLLSGENIVSNGIFRMRFLSLSTYQGFSMKVILQRKPYTQKEIQVYELLYYIQRGIFQ